MPQVRISKELNQNIYFLTFTISKWYYLFDRHSRWDILLNTLKYYQNTRSLKIYAWVFMINHIHLIAACNDMTSFVRDFKRYTSKQIKQNLLKYEPRVLSLFLNEDSNYHFWKDGNMPELIFTESFLEQKVFYIENNPVKRNYVTQPEDWLYSSAHPKPLLKLTHEYD